MARHDINHFRFLLIILTAMTLSIQGCVSIEIPGKDGKPKALGFAFEKPIKSADGNIYQIIAPGLSFRFVSSAPGVSLGWHELRLFYPAAPADAKKPAAIQTKCDGIDVGPIYIMGGIENIFAVPFPESGKNTMQLIIYSEANPTNTIIERTETK